MIIFQEVMEMIKLFILDARNENKLYTFLFLPRLCIDVTFPREHTPSAGLSEEELLRDWI